MAKSKSCACTGIRCCLRCDSRADKNGDIKYNIFTCCYLCGKIKPHQEVIVCERRPLLKCKNCSKEVEVINIKQEFSPSVETITVHKGFLSAKEEAEVVKEVDGYQWIPSQSGRNKQDFGPKVNFKRQKVKQGSFSGLPAFSQPLVKRIQQLEQEGLANFIPVELCNLEYVPERGSSIDPHLDDSWLWGDRLVTINLLSDTYLTFTSDTEQLLVPLLRCSLVIVSGGARHCWKHSISREHVLGRRIGITLRELSSTFLPGGEQEDTGKQLLSIASINSTSVFYYKNKFPNFCPICQVSLENAPFLLEPFCVPSPFWNGGHISTVSLLLKSIPFNESHHIGIVSPCDQRVHHYDTNGITWDHLTKENSQWLGAIVVPFNSAVQQRTCDQVVADMTAQAVWTAERYEEEHHNCLDFVVAILSAIFSWDCTRHTVSQLISAHMTRARAHEKLCILLTENEGLYVMNSKICDFDFGGIKNQECI